MIHAQRTILKSSSSTIIRVTRLCTLVEKLIPHFPFKMRYVLEGEQGISAARNRAIDEAVGDYLAFLDDECIVSPDWLSIAIADINQFRPMHHWGPFLWSVSPRRQAQVVQN